MGLKTELKKTAVHADLFSTLTVAQKEKNRMLVELSKHIYDTRKTLGMSQTEFAKQMNVSQPMISEWESGEYNFSVSTLADIFSALGLRLSFSVEKIEKNYIHQSSSAPVQYDIVRPEPRYVQEDTKSKLRKKAK